MSQVIKSQELFCLIETGRKDGDLLFKVTRIVLSGVLFKLWHYGWRKDLVRKRKAKEGFHKEEEGEVRFRKVKKDLGREEGFRKAREESQRDK